MPELTFYGGPFDGYKVKSEHVFYKGQYAEYSCVDTPNHIALYYLLNNRLEFVGYKKENNFENNLKS